ncbi:hypothetical protein B0H19DRAFT_1146183, partial [Mycena capillaripes]
MKNPDDSWDLAEITSLDGQPIVVQRPRPEFRPKERKVLVSKLLLEQRNTTVDREAAVQAAVEAAEAAVERKLQAVEAALENKLQAAVEKERAERRAAERASLKYMVLLRQEQVKAKEFLICERDVVERHESLTLSMQGFNDVIFDTRRIPGTGPRKFILTDGQKKLLKQNNLGYITLLVDPPPEKLSDARVARAHIAVLKILSHQELELCKALNVAFQEGRETQNNQQHTKPDIATALDRTRDLPSNLHNVLTAFLHTNPERLKLRSERSKPKVDLHLFVPHGTYTSVAQEREELARLRRELGAFQEQLSKAEEEAGMSFAVT